MSDDDQDDDRLHLVTNRMPTPEPRPDEAVALGSVYATVKGQRTAESLEFRLRDGTSFSMPSTYRPIIWGRPPATILLEYPGFFTVALTLVGHDELFKRIRDQRVTWIRECDETLAAALPVAVTRIEILRAYPSREVGTDPYPADLETADA